MVDFNFFSQPTGPNVPISLFADAATAGINAGNALPSMATSILNGVTSGIKQGQQIQEQAYDNQIKANAVEQLPVENRAREAQVTAAETQLELHQLELERAKELDALATDDARLKYEADISKLKEEKALRQKSAAFQQAFQGLNGQGKLNAVFGGQYNDLFASNPKLYESSLNSILFSQDLTEDQRRLAVEALNKKGAWDSSSRQAEANRQNFEKAGAKLLESSHISDWAEKLGVSAYDVPNRIEFRKQGEYVVTDGFLQPDDSGKGYVRDPNFDPKTSTYAVFNRDTGALLAEGVDRDEKKLYSDFTTFGRLTDGTYRSRAVESAGAATQTQQAPKTAPKVDSFGAPVTSPASKPAAPLDPLTARVTEVFDIKEAELPKMQPLITNLGEKLTSYRKNRAAPGAFKAVQDAVADIVQTKVKSDFEASPTAKAQYTPAKTEEYNSHLKAAVSEVMWSLRNPELAGAKEGLRHLKGGLEGAKVMGRAIARGFKDLYSSQDEQAAAIYEALAAKDSTELYYRRNQGAYDTKTKALIEKLAVQDAKESSSATRKIAGSAALSDFLEANSHAGNK